MGLVVDVLRRGSGTSIKENTARRFSQYPELISEISGFHEELIGKFSIILQAIAI